MSKVYRILVEPHAAGELDRLPKPVFMKIDAVISALAKNPRPFGVKKLDGPLHRIRVQSWRVLYSIFDEEAQIFILRVSLRNEKTYKFFS